MNLGHKALASVLIGNSSRDYLGTKPRNINSGQTPWDNCEPINPLKPSLSCYRIGIQK
jgi:hypothetical protein